MDRDRQRRPAYPSAKGVSLSGLIEALFCGNDAHAEEAAILIESYGEQALLALQPYFEDEQPDRRWWAIRAAAQINHLDARRHLIKALKDADLSVRQCAALALCQQPTATAVDDLIENLSDPDSLLRRLAANALIATGSPAVPSLLQVMTGGEPIPRLEAARALAKIGDPKATATLYAAWGEDSALLEYWANEGLDRMLTDMVYYYP